MVEQMNEMQSPNIVHPIQGYTAVSSMQVSTVPNQQVPNQQVPNLQADGTRRWFAHDSAGRCGIIQIVCGFILFLTGIIMIPTHTMFYFVGYGFWVPVFCWLSGGFGLHGSKTKKTCPIVAALIMSIFTAIMGFHVFVLSSAGLGIDESTRPCINYDFTHCAFTFSCYNYNCENKFSLPESVSQLNLRVALHVINLLTGLCLVVVPIIQSCISCRAVCCRRGTSQNPPGNVMYMPQNQPHVIVYSQAPGAWQNNGQVQVMNTGGMYPVQQQFYPQVPQYGPPGTYNVPMQGFQPSMSQGVVTPPYVPPSGSAQNNHPMAPPPSYEPSASLPAPVQTEKF